MLMAQYSQTPRSTTFSQSFCVPQNPNNSRMEKHPTTVAHSYKVSTCINHCFPYKWTGAFPSGAPHYSLHAVRTISSRTLPAMKVEECTCNCSRVHEAKGETCMSSRSSPKAPRYACIALSALSKCFFSGNIEKRSKEGIQQKKKTCLFSPMEPMRFFQLLYGTFELHAATVFPRG